MHDRGGDIASAATITPTTGFHKVTGSTTIDNIAAPVNGQTVALWFQSVITVRNQGGGTGNIRTAINSDESIAAGEIRVFRSDGTVWKEVGVGAVFGYTIKSDTVLAVDTASVDIQSIAGGAHLEGWMFGRSDKAGATDDAGIRMNNDSTANYDRQVSKFITSAGNTTLSGADLYAQTVFSVQNSLVGNSGAAGYFAQMRFTIVNYGDSVNAKVVDAQLSNRDSTTTGHITNSLVSGGWRGTAAINRITFIVSGGGTIFKAGSRFSIYTF